MSNLVCKPSEKLVELLFFASTFPSTIPCKFAYSPDALNALKVNYDMHPACIAQVGEGTLGFGEGPCMVWVLSPKENPDYH